MVLRLLNTINVTHMQARATALRCADWLVFEAFKTFSFCFVQNVPSNSGIMENIHYNEILGITPIKLLYYFSQHKTLPPPPTTIP